MINLLLMCSVGALCGLLMLKIKVPGGMFTGALVGSAFLSIVFRLGTLPSNVKTIAQIIAGAYIACGIDLNELKNVRQLIKPAIILLSGLLLTNVITGFVIWKLSDADLITALMCAAPGGVATIPLMAADMGADISKVTTVQICRVAVCIGTFPMFIMKANGKQLSDDSKMPGKGRARKNQAGGVNFRALFITLAVGAVAGLTGKKLGVPAGTILFSIIGVLLLKKNTSYAYMPLWMRRTAQCLSGACIGSSIHLNDLMTLGQLIIPAIIMLACYMGSCFLTGYILHRFYGMELSEGMFAATPAGSSDMALISEELGCKSTAVTELHIMRLLVVNIAFPQILVLIAGIFG